MDVSEDELQSLYTWVDEIPLSRPKRNIARDFSDGVLVAEIIAHYLPKYVELHSYSSANGIAQKMYNWTTLNQKVFRKVNFSVNKADCEAVCQGVPGAIERVLKLIKVKVAKYTAKQAAAKKEIGYEEYREAPPALPASTPGAMPLVPPSADPAPGMPPGYPPGMPSQQYHPPAAVSTPNTVPVHQAPPAAAPQPSPYGAPQSAIATRQALMVDQDHAAALADRDASNAELRETNSILETKVRKLEQLVRLKDAKIQTLMAKLQAAGL